MSEQEREPEDEQKSTKADPGAEDPATGELSPEEQMAAFEEALKDEDWGHQPC